MNAGRRPGLEAPRLAPLRGAANGAVGGCVYWAGAHIWPTSVAVVLAMLATSLIDARWGSAPSSRRLAAALVLTVLLEYDALMALSAASLPFAVPPNLALGFIMLAGHAASAALSVIPPRRASANPARAHPAPAHPAPADIVVALILGFAPAALLGVPGLAGLAVAILARIAFIAYVARPATSKAAALPAAGHLTAVCFYLGALATWAFVA